MDYNVFYLNHFFYYFVQLNNYRMPHKVPSFFVLAFSTLDNFNKYFTLYNQTAIGKYYVVKQQSTDMVEYSFKLCVMDIFCSYKAYYSGFLKLLDAINDRFNMKNILHISFDISFNPDHNTMEPK